MNIMKLLPPGETPYEKVYTGRFITDGGTVAMIVFRVEENDDWSGDEIVLRDPLSMNYNEEGALMIYPFTIHSSDGVVVINRNRLTCITRCPLELAGIHARAIISGMTTRDVNTGQPSQPSADYESAGETEDQSHDASFSGLVTRSAFDLTAWKPPKRTN